jgi:hypothetical protein
MLEGWKFTVYTDHKPLTYALSRTSDPWLARQARQLSYLAEHKADIRHIAGEENVVADTLSHPPSSAVALPATAWQEGKPEFSPGSPAARSAVCAVPAFPDMLDFAKHQRSCQVTLQASKSSSLQLRAVGGPACSATSLQVFRGR